MALTREQGQNAKLRKALAEALPRAGVPDGNVNCIEVPCIEHAPGPGFADLKARLALLVAGASAAEGLPDSAVLTSPEAARVFLEAWRTVSAGAHLELPLACVGKGTAAVVEGAGAAVYFQPSRADAETLAAELPLERFGPRILYAASAIAPGTLQEGLSARGFEVERLDAYTTRAVQEPTEELLALMADTDVATFGSPSAVRAWAQHCSRRPSCACIGGTSRAAAECRPPPHVRPAGLPSPGHKHPWHGA